jgi:hypothetical protein
MSQEQLASFLCSINYSLCIGILNVMGSGILNVLVELGTIPCSFFKVSRIFFMWLELEVVIDQI